MFLIFSRRRASYFQRLYIYNRDAGKCHYCNVQVTFNGFHADHVEPWSKSKNTSVNNLVASCYMCNIAKHTMNAERYKQLLATGGTNWRRSRYYAIKSNYSK
jgi:5-methylcytosine-specific restriction endonuclease McrA